MPSQPICGYARAGETEAPPCLTGDHANSAVGISTCRRGRGDRPIGGCTDLGRSGRVCREPEGPLLDVWGGSMQLLAVCQQGAVPQCAPRGSGSRPASTTPTSCWPVSTAPSTSKRRSGWSRGVDTSNQGALIDANEAAIEAAGVFQHSYTAPGREHGILEWETSTRPRSTARSFVDWVAALIAGQPLDDVHRAECTAG